MGETAEERARRLSQMGGGEAFWRIVQGDNGEQILVDICREMTNSCAEIMIGTPQRCTLGDNPLIKYTKYKFNFNGKR